MSKPLHIESAPVPELLIEGTPANPVDQTSTQLQLTGKLEETPATDLPATVTTPSDFGAPSENPLFLDKPLETEDKKVPSDTTMYKAASKKPVKRPLFQEEHDRTEEEKV